MMLKNIFVYPRYPENLRKLIHLAYNLWSLWDAEGKKIFYRIDPALFRDKNLNPVAFLHAIPEERLRELSKDNSFLYELEKIWEKYLAYEKNQTRYVELFKNVDVAYFSMEYGLHQSIPIYAGGLGILSGDLLKGVSDLGIPMVGIGLLYRYGYFTQRINMNGLQEEVYRENSVYYMPVKEMKTTEGNPIYINVDILNTPVKVKVWCIRVGKARLLLLDSNVEENPPEVRSITDHLYVAKKDVRLMQEMILGFGGVRILETIGIKPDIYHINEGHSAFLILERLGKLINRENYSFKEAYAIIKNSTIFTTHTPVEAGNENYPAEMIKKYLEKEIAATGLSFEEFFKYGKRGEDATFWLPAFAIRFSRYVNGVSKIHSEVSKKMWNMLFPQKIIRDIPIINITNAVHYSWLSSEMRELFERYLGTAYIYEKGDENNWERILGIPDEEIWEIHLKQKREMIIFLRKVVEKQYIEKGYSLVRIKKAQEMLNARYLTIGFARRFATYKRPTLIIRDKERLKGILTNSEKPVQLIFAGKAHPADFAGKNMIKEILDFAREYGVEDRVIFIENYTREIAMHLIQGVDVWLNTPVKPLEASGTSGIKAGSNGVLNLSVLDGWWPEAYNMKNGWAITAGESYTDHELRDTAEANQLYDLLEEEITALYYDRDELDIPREWVNMMKESIYTIFRGFNINRMLDEYAEKFYLPAIARKRSLLSDGGKQLKDVIRKADTIQKYWEKVYIKDVFADVDQKELLFVNDVIHIECNVYLDDIDSSLIETELFYSREKDDSYQIIKMSFVEKYQDKTGKYEGSVLLSSSGLQSIRVCLLPSDEDIRVLYPDLVKWREV